MKKAFISIFAVLLTLTLMISAALPASACGALKDPHSEFILNLWSEFVKDCKEITGDTIPTPVGGLSYREISDYCPDSNDESKNFKLVLATYASIEDAPSYRTDFGEYTYYNPHSTSDREYLIYLYNQDLVYTVEEAYYNNVEGLESALRALNGEALLKIGDTNGDFEVNIKDATFLQKYTAKLESVDKIYSLQLFRLSADLNRDSKINVKDATFLQKQLAKLLIPTTYDKSPATADSIAYNEVMLIDDQGIYNINMLVVNENQLKSLPQYINKEYTEEFFEEKSLIYIHRYVGSGMVEFTTEGVYREGNTLYVKCKELHPPLFSAVTDDIGIYHAALEIDKKYTEGVEKLVMDVDNSYKPFSEGIWAIPY